MSNKYYKLVIHFDNDIRYKSKIINIPNFPKIEIPNILFTNLMDVKELNELEDINMNAIYFYGPLPGKLECHGKYEIIEITKMDFISGVSLYVLRRLMDLRLIKYYLGLGIFNMNDNFVDRFNGHYSFYENPGILDKVFPKGSKKITDQLNPVILYCMFFSPQYEDIGYTIRTHNLLKHTKDTKIDVIGVSRYGYPLDKPKEYYKLAGLDEYYKDGVRYIKLLDKNDNFNDNNIVDYIKKYTNRLIIEAKKHNACIVHAASNWFNGLAGYYAARTLGIPCIYEVRGFWDESSVAMRPELYKADMIKMKQKMEDFVIRRVDKVITINDNLKRETVDRVIVDDVSIIYNGVDTGKFNKDDQIRCEVRNRYEINDDVMVFGYIGSLLTYEGLDYVLYSIKRLVNNGYKVKFYMIGDGKDRDNLLDLAKQLELEKENFEYLGKVSHDEVSDFYNMFDIIVYPRRDDKVCRTTSSSKIFEAMCMEKPVIVSELPAYREIITDGYNGLYCVPDDLDDIYRKMERLVVDDGLRTSIGTNARTWVEKNREWSKIGIKLANVYSALLQK